MSINASGNFIDLMNCESLVNAYQKSGGDPCTLYVDLAQGKIVDSLEEGEGNLQEVAVTFVIIDRCISGTS